MLKKQSANAIGLVDFGRRVTYRVNPQCDKYVKYGFFTLNIYLPALPEGWMWCDDFMEEIIRNANLETRGFRRARIYGPINSILARQYQYEQTMTEPMWRYRLRDRETKIKISQVPNLVRLPLMFPNAYAEPKSGKIPSDSYLLPGEDVVIDVEFGWLEQIVRKTSYQKANFSELADLSLENHCKLEFYVDPQDKKVIPLHERITEMKGSVEFTGTECISTTHTKLRLNFSGTNATSDYILLRIRNEDKGNGDPEPVIEKLKIQANGRDKKIMSGKYGASPEVWKRHIGSLRPSSEWYLIPYYDFDKMWKDDMMMLHFSLKSDGGDGSDGGNAVYRLVDIYIH